MTHRPTKSLGSKGILVIVGVVIVLSAAVTAIFLIGPIIGVLLAAVAGYVGYQFLRLMRLQRNSYLETGQDGIECRTALDERIAMSWGEIDQAGIAFDERQRRYLFVYRDYDDTLLTLPDDYSDFDALVSELESRVALRRMELGKKESVEERLKQEYREAQSGEHEIRDGKAGAERGEM